MPNWVFSQLKITGPKEQIEKILATGLDFEKILPTPPELDEVDGFSTPKSDEEAEHRAALTSKYGHDNWYDWRLEKWGTKWIAEVKMHDSTDTKIQADLVTAWSLPVGILRHLSRIHPDVTIRIVDSEEEAGFFVGGMTISNGDVTEDNIHKPSREELRCRGMIA